MPSEPTITLTATLQDFCGNAAGTISNPAKLRIALVGFGPALPRIAGTSNIAQVGPWYYYSTGAELSMTLWGNDVITPANTYYEIAVIDGEGNMVQCAAYQFTGTQTIDLSNAVPYNPLPPSVIALLAYGLCAGVVPGSVYTAPGLVIAATYNGVLQRPGVDFTGVGSSTVTLNFQTQAGDSVGALYST